jgi:RNA polymerase sigma-70 factor (ECF subfamily)
LVVRARQHIAEERRTPVSSAEQRRLLEAFVAAARNGDLAALEGLLASDVISYSDGGGFVRAARTPIAGREPVAKFIAKFASHFWIGVTLTWIETIGQSSVLMARDGAAVAIATIRRLSRGHPPDPVDDATE